MLKYTIDILSELKSRGYTTYRIRKEKLFSESTLQKFRKGTVVSADNINTLCKYLNCQPGDILEYVPDTSENVDNLSKLS